MTRATCTKEKLYEELDLKTLKNRPWFRKLCSFFKIFKIKPLGSENNTEKIWVHQFLAEPKTIAAGRPEV